jgi:hypothetical protein
MAALASFFSGHGVLPSTVDVDRDANVATFAFYIRENAVNRSVTPDPRPPRA